MPDHHTHVKEIIVNANKTDAIRRKERKKATKKAGEIGKIVKFIEEDIEKFIDDKIQSPKTIAMLKVGEIGKIEKKRRSTMLKRKARKRKIARALAGRIGLPAIRGIGKVRSTSMTMTRVQSQANSASTKIATGRNIETLLEVTP